MEMTDFLGSEKELASRIEALALQDISAARDLAQDIAHEAMSRSLSRAESSAAARLICRFLLHRKNKSRLTDCIRESEAIRRAVFGCLNTYKHSLVFLLKRIARENDLALMGEVLRLLGTNPWNDSGAPDYSDRLSVRFVAERTLAAPEDYLCLSEGSRELLKQFINSSDSLQ